MRGVTPTVGRLSFPCGGGEGLAASRDTFAPQPHAHAVQTVQAHTINARCTPAHTSGPGHCPAADKAVRLVITRPRLTRLAPEHTQGDPALALPITSHITAWHSEQSIRS